MTAAQLHWVGNGVLVGALLSWFLTDMVGGRHLLGTLLCLGLATGTHVGASIAELRRGGAR